MIEIEITNYESIDHTKIVVDGLTTIVGRNYLGKSSILRAINAALTNKDGTDFISWGKTFCEVHIKFPDLDILWHKENGKNYYKINGKEYTKIGRGDPPKEILDAGFKPLEIGDKKINLNYAVQFFPLFLVDKKDSKSADILTSVYGLDCIYKAIDLCNKEQRSNSDLLKIREKDLKQTEETLEKFKTFPNIISKIPDIKKKKKNIDEKENEIERALNWNNTLRVLATTTRRLKPIIDVIIPSEEAISKNLLEYQKIVNFQNKKDELNTFLNKIKNITKISMPDKCVTDIKGIFGEYQKVLILLNRYKKLYEDVDKLSKIKNVTLPESSIDVEDIPKLHDMIKRAKTLGLEVKSLSVTINETNTEIVKISKEIDSFDICPLCGAKRG